MATRSDRQPLFMGHLLRHQTNTVRITLHPGKRTLSLYGKEGWRNVYPFWIISKLVDRIFYGGLSRARKERQIAPQASAGCPPPINPPLAFRKRERGWKKKPSMKEPNAPATAKEGSLPHDCQQYGFPSAPLKSLGIQNMPVP